VFRKDGTFVSEFFIEPQTLAIDLAPGEIVYSQTNCMCWMNDAVEMNTNTGGGMFAGTRWLSLRRTDLGPVLGRLETPTLLTTNADDAMWTVAAAESGAHTNSCCSISTPCDCRSASV